MLNRWNFLKTGFYEGIKFEYESSNVARKWANYLGHDEPDAARELSIDDAKELYGYVESLLDTLYVKWEELNRQRENLVKEPSTENEASAAEPPC